MLSKRTVLLGAAFLMIGLTLGLLLGAVHGTSPGVAIVVYSGKINLNANPDFITYAGTYAEYYWRKIPVTEASSLASVTIYVKVPTTASGYYPSNPWFNIDSLGMAGGTAMSVVGEGLVYILYEEIPLGTCHPSPCSPYYTISGDYRIVVVYQIT